MRVETAFTVGLTPARIWPQMTDRQRVGGADREEGDDELVQRERHDEQRAADHRRADQREGDVAERLERRSPRGWPPPRRRERVEVREPRSRSSSTTNGSVTRTCATITVQSESCTSMRLKNDSRLIPSRSGGSTIGSTIRPGHRRRQPRAVADEGERGSRADHDRQDGRGGGDDGAVLRPPRSSRRCRGSRGSARASAPRSGTCRCRRRRRRRRPRPRSARTGRAGARPRRPSRATPARVIAAGPAARRGAARARSRRRPASSRPPGRRPCAAPSGQSKASAEARHDQVADQQPRRARRRAAA